MSQIRGTRDGKQVTFLRDDALDGVVDDRRYERPPGTVDGMPGRCR
jgi:hypothetical protein